MRIVFLGDSLVLGEYGGSFVAEIAARLPAHTFINAGESGCTLLNLLDRVDAVLAHAPDGVCLMAGGNDALSYSQPRLRPYYAQMLDIAGGLVTHNQFAQAYRELLTRIQLAGARAWAVLPPLEYSLETADAMRQYNDLARAAAGLLGVPVLDLLARLNPPLIAERPELTIADLNLISHRMSVGWADYETERLREGFSYSFNGLHFTPETARLVAEWVIELLALPAQ